MKENKNKNKNKFKKIQIKEKDNNNNNKDNNKDKDRINFKLNNDLKIISETNLNENIYKNIKSIKPLNYRDLYDDVIK
jgi:hypothetical protein